MKLFFVIALIVLACIVAFTPDPRKAKQTESKSLLDINWTHYSFQATEQGLKVYENGAERKDLTGSLTLDAWSPTKLQVQNPFPYLNRIPTEAERNAIYNQGMSDTTITGSAA